MVIDHKLAGLNICMIESMSPYEEINKMIRIIIPRPFTNLLFLLSLAVNRGGLPEEKRLPEALGVLQIVANQIRGALH